MMAFDFGWRGCSRRIIHMRLDDLMLLFKFVSDRGIGYVRIRPVILGQYASIGHGQPPSIRLTYIAMTIELLRRSKVGHDVVLTH